MICGGNMRPATAVFYRTRLSLTRIALHDGAQIDEIYVEQQRRVGLHKQGLENTRWLVSCAMETSNGQCPCLAGGGAVKPACGNVHDHRRRGWPGGFHGGAG